MGEEHSFGIADRIADRVASWRGDRRVAGAPCACLALAAAFAWWRSGQSSTPSAARSKPPPAVTVPAAATSTTRAQTQLVVDVVGAVHAPGIVRVAAGARIFDVIDAAGGALPKADLAQLNLAALVADGTRIAVPLTGQPPPAADPGAVTGGAAPSPASGGTNIPAGPVNLNTATAAQLEDLPGVGPATAAGDHQRPRSARPVSIGRRSRSRPRHRRSQARPTARPRHGVTWKPSRTSRSVQRLAVSSPARAWTRRPRCCSSVSRRSSAHGLRGARGGRCLRSSRVQRSVQRCRRAPRPGCGHRRSRRGSRRVPRSRCAACSRATPTAGRIPRPRSSGYRPPPAGTAPCWPTRAATMACGCECCKRATAS